MSEMKFAEGMYFNRPHENAPDFVLGSISIRPEVFAEWLSKQTPNEKGYVRLKVNTSKNTGEPYVAVDEWEKKAAPPPGVPENYEGVSPGEFDSDIPF